MPGNLRAEVGHRERVSGRKRFQPVDMSAQPGQCGGTQAEQQAQQRQAELAKQQAAQALAKQREEAERDPTTTKAALAAIDDVAKNDLMAQAQAELMNDPGKDSVTKKVKLAGADTDYEYTVRRA
jgi:hypothetical protein